MMVGLAGGASAASGTVFATGEHEDDERIADAGGDETDDDVPDAAVRVAHFSPDAPDVDVYVDGTQVLADVSYGTVSEYLEIAPGTYTVQITPSEEDESEENESEDDDEETDTAETVVFEDEVTIDQGFYTAAAIGVLQPGREDRPGRGAGQQAPAREFTVTVFADGETTLEELDASIDEPTEVPSDATCPVCNMVPAQYPDWNAQLVHEDEERVFFCTSGCMTAYYVVPERFDAPDAAIAGVWVTDFVTSDLIDGLEANYVLETDTDRVDDPMMRNPLPFVDRASAIAYVEQYDDLAEDDVVTIDEFDQDIAELYRERFLTEDTD